MDDINTPPGSNSQPQNPGRNILLPDIAVNPPIPAKSFDLKDELKLNIPGRYISQQIRRAEAAINVLKKYRKDYENMPIYVDLREAVVDILPKVLDKENIFKLEAQRNYANEEDLVNSLKKLMECTAAVIDIHPVADVLISSEMKRLRQGSGIKR